MRLFGNILWLFLGGFLLSLGWLFAAGFCAISVIGLPFCKPCLTLAKLAFAPFGKEVISSKEYAPNQKQGVLTTVVNVVWALTFGISLFLSHAFVGIINCITVIGIPMGLQSFKIAVAAFTPFSIKIVSVEEAKAIRTHNATTAVANRMAA